VGRVNIGIRGTKEKVIQKRIDEGEPIGSAFIWKLGNEGEKLEKNEGNSTYLGKDVE